MAWTVAFALLGAIVFSMTIAPVLISCFFHKEIREWRNPLVIWITKWYRHALIWSIHHRWVMVGVTLLALSGSLVMARVIGSEFLPHLNEGSIWVRGTLAPSTGPTESTRVANQVRTFLASFPEVTQVTSQTGRPDDGQGLYGVFQHRVPASF